jgi:hypothetical protein
MKRVGPMKSFFSFAASIVKTGSSGSMSMTMARFAAAIASRDSAAMMTIGCPTNVTTSSTSSSSS